MHQGICRVTSWAFRPPVAFRVRALSVWICVIDVPIGCAKELARLAVRHFDPGAGWIGSMPKREALDSFCQGGLRIVRGARRDEELEQLGRGLLEGVNEALYQLLEFCILDHLRNVEIHRDAVFRPSCFSGRVACFADCTEVRK